MKPPRITQLAFCTADLPNTVRRYTEIFGYRDAGGDILWGEWLARNQGVGDEVAFLTWWLVGRQSFCQLEFFQHTVPPQKPLPAEWSPSDIGWVRWGFAVEDFEGCVARLHADNIPTYTAPEEHRGIRRVCFRDPSIGAVVEVLEASERLPGGIREPEFISAATTIYAAVSVRSLAVARSFLIDGLGMIEEPATLLHDESMEHLWGLGGAERSAFVVRGGDLYLEVVEYQTPTPREPDADRFVTDQGMSHIAIGYRERAGFDQLVERAVQAGATLHAPLGPPPEPAGTYMTSPDGIALEIVTMPQEFDVKYGLVPWSSNVRSAPE